KNAVTESWFQAAGKSLTEVQQQINHMGKSASFAFPQTLQLSLKVDIEATHARVNNVLAYLPERPTSTSSSARITIISAVAIPTRLRRRKSGKSIPALTTTLPGLRVYWNLRVCSRH